MPLPKINSNKPEDNIKQTKTLINRQKKAIENGGNQTKYTFHERQKIWRRKK
jgi:hypothetical protein